MKKRLLELNGVKQLSKSDQGMINGGGRPTNVVCSSNAHCAWLFGPGWICMRSSFFSKTGVCEIA